MTAEHVAASVAVSVGTIVLREILRRLPRPLDVAVAVVGLFTAATGIAVALHR